MHTYRGLVFALFVPAVVALLGALAFAADVELRERFRREAPAAWQLVIDRSREASCNVTWSQRFFVPGKEHKTEELAFQIARSGDNQLLKQVTKEGREVGSEQVFCANDRYAFRLDRASDTQQWGVSAVAEKTAFRDPLDGNVGPMICRSVLLHSVYLPDLLRHKGFSLVDIQQQDGKVVVEFTFDPSSDPKWVSRGTVDPSTSKVRGGTLTLLPDHKWVIDSYDIQVEYRDGEGGTKAYELSADYEYEFPDGEPWPVLKSTHEYNAGGLEFNFAFADWNWSPRPKSYFQMSHFDLPEPAEYTPPRGRMTWFVWINIGIILLILGGIVRKRAKSKQSAPATDAA